MPISRARSRFFASIDDASSASSPDSSSPGEQLVEQLVEVLRDRALLRARCLLELARAAGRARSRISCAAVPTDSISRGASRAVVAGGGLADQLAEPLRVLAGDVLRQVGEDPARKRARLLERRHHLVLGPVREPTGPELVVLVEPLVLAGREVVAAALESIVERRQLLVAIDVDLLGLAADLVLEVGEVGGALLLVDAGHDRRGEVEDLLELARRDVEQVADPARDALEEPDVRDRRGEVDVPHALAAHLLARHLDAAALADDPLVANALVLAAVALPVLRRTEDALAEQAVALGLQGAVVDGLRLGDLAHRPVTDLLRRSEPDPDRVEVVDVDLRQGDFSFGEIP